MSASAHRLRRVRRGELQAERPQAVGLDRRYLVRPAHAMPQRKQQPRDPAHPGARDADQMDAHFSRDENVREDLAGIH